MTIFVLRVDLQNKTANNLCQITIFNFLRIHLRIPADVISTTLLMSWTANKNIGLNVVVLRMAGGLKYFAPFNLGKCFAGHLLLDWLQKLNKSSEEWVQFPAWNFKLQLTRGLAPPVTSSPIPSLMNLGLRDEPTPKTCQTEVILFTWALFDDFAVTKTKVIQIDYINLTDSFLHSFAYSQAH